MADEETEWTVVKHVRFPIVEDTVIGRYPTEADAISAFNHVTSNRQWFTEYSIEHRLKGMIKASASGDKPDAE